MATIAGLATIDMMDSTPLGDVRFNSDVEMLFSYVDYVAGGLTNNDSCIAQIDFNFWQEYFQQKQLDMTGYALDWYVQIANGVILFGS